jgi:hypothetical protein
MIGRNPARTVVIHPAPSVTVVQLPGERRARLTARAARRTRSRRGMYEEGGGR